ncbi:MAG: hypothetical protein U0930_06400 [Pirellulales bacterium]
MVAIPLWSVSLFAISVSFGQIKNPLGLPIYLMATLILSLFLVPATCFLIAPKIARWFCGSVNVAFLFHGVFATVLLVIIFGWPKVAIGHPSLVWTVIPYTLTLLLAPPMLTGSLAYSVRKIAERTC